AVGGSALELLPDRAERVDAIADDLPRGRRWHGRLHFALQMRCNMLTEAAHRVRRARAITSTRDPARSALIAMGSRSNHVMKESGIPRCGHRSTSLAIHSTGVMIRHRD